MLSIIDKGRGIPLVLLHGFPLDRRMWEAQISELSSSYRVIAPDLRGFGQSQSDEPFAIADLADDVHATLEKIGALPCVLAGLSMGGYVSLAYALKYSTDLRALILIDTRPQADTPDQRNGRTKMIELACNEGSKAVTQQMIPKLLAEDVPHTRPAIANALLRMGQSLPPLTIEHALEAMRNRPDQSSRLSSIKTPTLVIVGDVDAIIPVDVARSMQQSIPGAQLAIIKASGHMSPMEQPAQVNQAIARFIRSLA
jgi:pimeloyl-ACP methyl ester carboxylesterase